MKTISKSLQKTNLPLFLILAFSLLSCSKDGIEPPENGEVVISSSTTDTIVHVVVGNDKVPIYLSIPKGCDKKSLPAVVVMHGSDRMWSNHDPNNGAMSGQFNEWRELFDENCIVGAFVDSYSGRGVTTRSGKWTTAPDNFKISSQFIRPRDANAALALLQKLTYSDGTPIVRPADVGLLGFSDGATAVASTLYDTDTTPGNWEWKQTFDGKEYDQSSGILAPEPKPDVGFAGGVFYYGGSVGYDYWGASPCGDNALEGNIYLPYAPLLYQIPTEGYLTENTLCLVNILKEKQMPVKLNLYEGVGHGFDFENNDKSALARSEALEWFKEILKM